MPARVLVAHPDATERSRIAGVVRGVGLDVVEAHDGLTAIALADGTSLAFVAPRLGRNDGLFVAGRLRQNSNGSGPAVVLLNDVYPVAQPKDRFLREFGLSEVLSAPADKRTLVELLSRMRRLPRRVARDSAKSTNLRETPLVLVMTRLHHRAETSFVYARRGEEAIFLALVNGEVAQVRSNHSETTTDEQLLLSALGWAEGEAVVITDPEIELTSSAKIALMPLLDRVASPPLVPALAAAAELALSRTGRIVVEPGEDPDAVLAAHGASLYERQILELADGERSLQRLSGLAEVGRLPLAAIVLRLEAVGLIRRRRPGAPKRRADASSARPSWSSVPQLTEAKSSEVPATGLLGIGDLGRLLVRLEQSRTSAVLAIKGKGRTIELALRDGVITGAHAWGSTAAADPVQKLATMSELRPADVPLIRRLHAQDLVAEALVMVEAEWSLRRGEAIRMVETVGISSAALVTELLRDGRLRLEEGKPPGSDVVASITAALALTAGEAAQIASWSKGGQPPTTEWLRSIATLLDSKPTIGRAVHERRALPASPQAESTAKKEDDLDSLFKRALDEGMRAGARAGAQPARPARAPNGEKPAVAAHDSPGTLSGSSVTGRAFSLEQGASGVVVKVGDEQVPIDRLLQEVDDLRRETGRLRSELAQRNNEVATRTHEVEAVTKTVHELEEFIIELRSSISERERSAVELTTARGHLGAELEALQLIAVEKDRQLASQLESQRALEVRLAEALRAGEQERRAVKDLRRESDGFKERAGRLDRDLAAREESLRNLQEQLRLAGEKVAQTERELTVARRERGELTAKVTAGAVRPERRGLFRDARGERREPSQPDAARVAEERRLALEAMRAETVSQSHRVIELEGQITRQEAELARQRRERERLDERLASTLAEAASRAEEEAAHRARWQKGERLLAERTSSLQVREEEIKGLKNLQAELTADLEGTRVALREREDSLAAITDERSELRARSAELDGELTRLRNEVASFAEERGRFEWTVEEARQTSARATSALDAVRAAREELGARLNDTIAQKTSLAESNQRLNAEVGRLSGELQQEREGRSQERATLEGKLDARDDELAGLEKGLRDSTTELGKLRDLMPALERRHGEAVDRAASLENELKEARTVSGQLTRNLETQRAESEQLAKTIAQLQSDLDATHSGRQHEGNTLREQLEAVIAERDATELRLQSALRDLETQKVDVDRIEKAREQLQRELDNNRSSYDDERAALRSQAQEALTERDAIDHRLQTSLRELAGYLDRTPTLKRERDDALARIPPLEEEVVRLRRELNTETARDDRAQDRLKKELDHVTELQSAIETREASLAALRAEFEAASEERIALRAKVEQVVAERDEQAERLQGTIARSKRELVDGVTTWKARCERFEESVQRLTEELKEQAAKSKAQGSDIERLNTQMNGARKRIAQDVRRISELVALAEDLKARLSEREGQVRGLQAQVGERAQETERLSTELTSRKTELATVLAGNTDMTKSLSEGREKLLALTRSERELGERVASLDDKVATLTTELERLSTERTTLRTQLEEEQRQAALQSSTASRSLAKLRSELKEAREEARIATVRERTMRGRMATAEADVAGTMSKSAASVNEAALLKRQRELNVRIANLEQDIAGRIANEAALTSAADSLHEQSTQATSSADEAQRHAARLVQEIEKRTERETELELRVRDLESALMQREQEMEMRDLLVAERDAKVSETEEEVARLKAKLEQAERHMETVSSDLEQRDAKLGQLGSAKPSATRSAAARDTAPTEPRRVTGAPPIHPSTAPEATRDDSLRRLDEIFSEVDRLADTAPTTGPADDSASSGEHGQGELTRQKQVLLEASNRLNRELTRLRDELERRAADLAAIDDDEPPEGELAQRELEQRRHSIEDELHRIQANLGIARVRMADINRQIMEKNRLLQRLIESQA